MFGAVRWRRADPEVCRGVACATQRTYVPPPPSERPDSAVEGLCVQAECHMLADQHESCNEQGCPIDCEGEWGPWGECMAPCGTLGAQIRRFSVRQHEQFGGRRESCDAADGQAESRNCTGVQHCLPPAALGSWPGSASRASTSSGGGLRWARCCAAAASAARRTASPAVAARTGRSSRTARSRQTRRRLPRRGADLLVTILTAASAVSTGWWWRVGSLVAPSDRSSSRPAEAPRAAAELDESVQVSPS